MDEKSFIRLVTDYLNTLLERIEENYWDVVECELNSGVLNIYTHQQQVFIINRNLPRQELWLSSPYSGGSHFNYVNEDWLNTRTRESFENLLFKELDALK